jgi:CubicO group peptidase (beta-lactamase class C family)
MIFFKKIVVFSLLIILSINSFAQSNPNASYMPPTFADAKRAEKIKALAPVIEKMYADFAQANHFPGYAYGIVIDGQLIVSGSKGFTDINNKIPATTNSMFRIASMSKSFTALAICKLRDAGKLQLDISPN